MSVTMTEDIEEVVIEDMEEAEEDMIGTVTTAHASAITEMVLTAAVVVIVVAVTIENTEGIAEDIVPEADQDPHPDATTVTMSDAVTDHRLLLVYALHIPLLLLSSTSLRSDLELSKTKLCDEEDRIKLGRRCNLLGLSCVPLQSVIHYNAPLFQLSLV